MCTDSSRRKPTTRWQDIKMGFHEIRRGVIWIYVARDRTGTRTGTGTSAFGFVQGTKLTVCIQRGKFMDWMRYF